MSESPRNPQQAPEPVPSRRRIIVMPVARERAWGSSLASLLIHVGVIILLILPSIRPELIIVDEQGAGGPGPAGGGGGGNRGTGGVRSERIQYIAAAPEPVPVPVPPRIIPPLVEKKPEVVVPVPTPPVAAANPDSAKAAEATAPIPGVGGGTGSDGSGGTGPGSGGGKGSGVGTGTGSGVGPGTGGGSGTIYPPTVTQLVLLPVPAPNKVKPYEMEAVFDVDSTGRATLVQWNKPKDNGYAEKVLKTLLDYRFRPAVRLDGTPVRAMTVIRASIGK